VPPGIAAQIAGEGGRVPFARFMELALTHPTEGYYSGAGTILGARGHFSTAPTLSPEFNDTLARLVVELGTGLLTEAGASVRLVELGGGEGHLAGAILRRLAKERPDLTRRVGYTIVDVGEGLRAHQRRALARALADGQPIDWASTITEAVSAAEEVPTVVLCNEFIDALPVHLVDVREDGTREAWVELTAADAVGAAALADTAASAGAAGLREVWRDVTEEAAGELRTVFGTEDATTLRTFSRDGFLEVRPGVGRLMGESARWSCGSCLLAVDYGEWSVAKRTLRGYYRHQLVSDLYARVGAQDLTADVDFSALEAHGREAGFETVLYTTVAAMLRSDSGEERLTKLEQKALASLEADRRATVLRALLDDQDVGGAFKVMLLVRG
jgi:SAM-dependent MidA family methyltransferase